MSLAWWVDCKKAEKPSDANIIAKLAGTNTFEEGSIKLRQGENWTFYI